MGTPVALQIFVAAAKAVVRVFIIAVGCWARRKELLDADTARVMSRLNGAIFLPCLLFTVLGKAVNAEQLQNVWLLPIAAAVHIFFGWVLGKGVCRAFDVPNEFRGPLVAAASFGNTFALPVVLLDAIIGSGNKVGKLQFTREDNAAMVLYLSAYMTVLTTLMWTLGPVWMKGEDRVDVDESFEETLDEDPALEGGPPRSPTDGPSVRPIGEARSESRVNLLELELAEGAIGKARSESREDLLELELAEGGSGPSAGDRAGASRMDPERRRAKKSFRRRCAAALAPAANVNQLAAVLGILVGLTSPLQRALFDEDGALYVLGSCAELVGAAAIPQVIIILGASLANGPDHSLCDRRTAVALGFGRLGVLAMLNVGTYYCLRAAIPAAAVPASKAFWLTFLIEGATPTANNMMLQVQMYGSKRAAGGIGACIFWQYAMAPVVLTGTISLFLAIL